MSGAKKTRVKVDADVEQRFGNDTLSLFYENTTQTTP